MSRERDHLKPIEPGHQPDQASSIESTHRQSRIRAILTACAILAFPIGYLAEYYGHSRPIFASSMPTPTSTQDIASLEEAARISPTIDHRLNLSVRYIEVNQPERAIPILNALLANSPTNAVAWNDLCAAHNMLAEYRQAVSACNKAIKIDPSFQLARNNLLWAQDEESKTQKSLASSEQGAPARKTASDYIAEGLNFLHLGNYDEAIRAWQRALAIDPHSALAANNIGAAYMSKGQPQVALTWFQKALVLDPTLKIARNNVAWAKSEIGKLRK